jgi:hypothetical protein
VELLSGRQRSSTQIIDEHWYAKDFLTDRDDYYLRPTYPLTVVNVDPEDYIDGPLENFTAGALRLHAGQENLRHRRTPRWPAVHRQLATRPRTARIRRSSRSPSKATT